MSDHDQFEYSEKRTFLGKYGFVIGIGILAVVGVTLVSKMFTGHSRPAPAKPVEMVMIKAPLPPPPPPPPPPENQPKEEMMEQSPVDAAEAKPVDDPSPSPAIGTNITGNGPADGFGLGANGKGMMGGGNRGGAAGSRFGWYANQVTKSISDALSQNPRTRSASFNIKVRIWSDAGGRITRAKLAELTGDPVVDDAIRHEVLDGFQLKEPPPDGMPMPIVMRLIARRPN